MKHTFLFFALLISIASCKSSDNPAPIQMPDTEETIENSDDDDNSNINDDIDDVSNVAGLRASVNQSIYFTVRDDEQFTTFTLKGYYFGNITPPGGGTEAERAALPAKYVKTLEFPNGTSPIKSKALKAGFWSIQYGTHEPVLILIVPGKKSYVQINAEDGNSYADEAGISGVAISGKTLSKTNELDVNANGIYIPTTRTISAKGIVNLTGSIVMPVGQYQITLSDVAAGSGTITTRQVGTASVVSGKKSTLKTTVL